MRGGGEEGAAKLKQIGQAAGKLNDAQRKGKITADQLRKSTAAGSVPAHLFRAFLRQNSRSF